MLPRTSEKAEKCPSIMIALKLWKDSSGLSPLQKTIYRKIKRVVAVLRLWQSTQTTFMIHPKKLLPWKSRMLNGTFNFLGVNYVSRAQVVYIYFGQMQLSGL